jgi:putative glutamine amidotransferase
MRKPMIGVSTDLVTIDDHRFLATGEKYLLPITAIGARPRLLPSLPGQESVEDLLDGLDGLLLTGAVSNIEPRHYGGGAAEAVPPFDPERDATVLPLIVECLRRKLPLLALCRGLQEMNVALGGTLHPQVHEQPGRHDHRAVKDRPHEEQYAVRHKVRLTPGGLLAGLAEGRGEVMVNSLHEQAIDRLGRGLAVEATALDGTIEAVRVEKAGSFALGLQWHPEWHFAEDRFSQALFKAFAESLQAKSGSR